MLPGKIWVNTPVCPDASPLQCPDPEQLFCIPRWEIPILKRRCCCSEFELHTQQPDGIISRTILRHIPDPAAGDPDLPIIPNIFRWAGGCPTPQSVPIILLGFRYPLLLGFVRLLWEFLLV
jgi:hypothetical protein